MSEFETKRQVYRRNFKEVSASCSRLLAEFLIYGKFKPHLA